MKLPRVALGIPLHPLLVHFPSTFWLAVPLLDVAALCAGPEPWWTVALGATVIGVLIGAVVIVTGLLEYLEPSVVGGHQTRGAARHQNHDGAGYFYHQDGRRDFLSDHCLDDFAMPRARS
ncbi:MAG: DUF2231 domain-containing protein, partial [Pyrinomonadaceae bacterium]